MLAHSLVVFALPDVQDAPAQAVDPCVWLSVSADESGAAGATSGPAHAEAYGKADARAAAEPARTPVARRRPARKVAPRNVQVADAAPHAERAVHGDAPESVASDVAHGGAPESVAADVPQAAPAAALGSGTAPAGAGSGAGRDGLGIGAGTRGGAVHGPGLLAVRAPCRGYFPASAQADHGKVRIQIHVDPSGRPRLSQLLSELPLGQGFGPAARACAATLRFAPAVDGQGIAVAGEAKLELSFDRSQG